MPGELPVDKLSSEKCHQLLSLEEEWIMYGLEAVEQVLEQGILKKQLIEAVSVLKLPHYEHGDKHKTWKETMK